MTKRCSDENKQTIWDMRQSVLDLNGSFADHDLRSDEVLAPTLGADLRDRFAQPVHSQAASSGQRTTPFGFGLGSVKAPHAWPTRRWTESLA